MPSPTLGYAGLCTQQAPTLGIHALTAGGCARVIVETASRARAGRPDLARLLEQRRAGAA